MTCSVTRPGGRCKTRLVKYFCVMLNIFVGMMRLASVRRGLEVVLMVPVDRAQIKELQTDLNTHGTKIDGAQFFIQLQKEDND